MGSIYSRMISGALVSAIMSMSSVHGQIVDVQTKQSNIEVGRSGVDIDVNADRNADVRADGNWREVGAALSTDQEIAQWLLVDQRATIDFARYGMERTQSPEVRKLAEAVVQEHQRLHDELMRVNATAAIRAKGTIPAQSTGPANVDVEIPARRVEDERREAVREEVRDARRDRDGTRRPLENIIDRIEDRVERVTDRAERVLDQTAPLTGQTGEGTLVANGASGPSTFVSVHQSISQQLQQIARADLEKQQGYEFDASFVGMLTCSHMQQQATIAVLSTRASKELKPLLVQATATIQQHRDTADRVMRNLHR